jgi:hypothetical protein
MSTNIKTTTPINGIDVEALHGFAGQVTDYPAAGRVTFGVLTIWQGGTRTRATTLPIQLGSSSLERDFVIEADEPAELLGTNKAANPQGLLLAALNACVTATMPPLNPGYDKVECEVEIESSADKAELEKLRSRVQATSPNFHNFVRAIDLNTRLTVRN